MALEDEKIILWRAILRVDELVKGSSRAQRSLNNLLKKEKELEAQFKATADADKAATRDHIQAHKDQQDAAKKTSAALKDQAQQQRDVAKAEREAAKAAKEAESAKKRLRDDKSAEARAAAARDETNANKSLSEALKVVGQEYEKVQRERAKAEREEAAAKKRSAAEQSKFDAAILKGIAATTAAKEQADKRAERAAERVAKEKERAAERESKAAAKAIADRARAEMQAEDAAERRQIARAQAAKRERDRLNRKMLDLRSEGRAASPEFMRTMESRARAEQEYQEALSKTSQIYRTYGLTQREYANRITEERILRERSISTILRHKDALNDLSKAQENNNNKFNTEASVEPRQVGGKAVNTSASRGTGNFAEAYGQQHHFGGGAGGRGGNVRGPDPLPSGDGREPSRLRLIGAELERIGKKSTISTYLLRKFFRVFSLAYAGGTALGFLASIVSSLVGGFMALAGAIGPVVGILGTIPGIVGAAAMSMGALFGGLKNVLSTMKAQKAMEKSSTSSANTQAKAQKTAARSIRDAQQSVQEAYQNSAQSAEENKRRVAEASANVSRTATEGARSIRDAEIRLADAQGEAKDAQQRLNDTRREAISQIAELARKVRDAGFAEEEAVLSVEAAQKKLWEVQHSAGSSDYDLRKAELDYREAQARLDDARSDRQKAIKESDEAQRVGVDGSKSVIDAQKALIDSNRAVSDAVRDLSDARTKAAEDNRAAQQGASDAIRQQKQDAADSARSIRDSQERLADAFEASAEAASKSSAAADQYQQELKKLSPEGRQFVAFLNTLRPQMAELRKSAEAGLLPGVQRGLTDLMALMPMLQGSLGRTAAVLGNSFADLGKRLSSGETAGALDRLFRSNETVTRNFADVLNNVVVALIHIGDAARPLTEWVSAVFLRWSENAVKASQDTNRMTSFFAKTKDVMQILGDIIGGVWGGLRNVAGAGAETGRGMLESIRDVAQGWRDWTEKDLASSSSKIRAWYAASDPVVRKLADLIRRSFNGVFNFGIENNMLGPLTTLSDKVLPSIGRIIGTLAANGGDAFAGFMADVASATEKIVNGGLLGFLNTFLGIMGDVVGAFAWFANLPGINTALKIFFGILVGFKVMGFLTTLLVKPFVMMAGALSNPLLAAGFSRVSNGMLRMETSTNRVVGAIGRWAAANRQASMMAAGFSTTAATSANSLAASAGRVNAAAGAAAAGRGAAAAGSAGTVAAVGANASRGAGAMNAMRAAGSGLLAMFNPLTLGITAVASGFFAWKNASDNAKQATDELTGTLDQATGKFTAASDEFVIGKLMEDISPEDVLKLKDIGVNLGDANKAAQAGGTEMKNYLDKLEGLKSTYPELIPQLQGLQNSIKNQNETVHDSTKKFEANKAALEAQRDAEIERKAKLENMTVAQYKATEEAKKAYEQYKKNTEEAKKNAAAILEVYDANMKGRNAESDYYAALDEVRESTKKNGRNNDLRTKEGRENNSALNSAITASKAYASALAGQGASAETVQKFMAGARNEIVAAAINMGYSREKAIALADALGVSAEGAKQLQIDGANLKPFDVRADARKWDEQRIALGKQVLELNNKIANPQIHGDPAKFIAERDKVFNDLAALKTKSGVPYFDANKSPFEAQKKQLTADLDYIDSRLIDPTFRGNRQPLIDKKKEIERDLAEIRKSEAVITIRANDKELQSWVSAFWKSFNAGGGGVGGLAAGLIAASKTVVKRARGGIIPGTGNEDTVPAMLTPGEFVLRKSAVKAIGIQNLARLNGAKSGKDVGGVQFFHSGGLVGGISKGMRSAMVPMLALMSGLRPNRVAKDGTWDPTLTNRLLRRPLTSLSNWSNPALNNAWFDRLARLIATQPNVGVGSVAAALGRDTWWTSSAIRKYRNDISARIPKKGVARSRYNIVLGEAMRQNNLMMGWVSDAQRRLGMQVTGGWSESMYGPLKHALAHALKIAPKNSGSAPVGNTVDHTVASPVTWKMGELETAIRQQSVANSTKEEYLRLLDKISRWDVPLVLDKLSNQTPTEGMALLKDLVNQGPSKAKEYEALLRRDKETNVNGEEMATASKMVSFIAMNPTQGIRGVARELGAPDYAVVRMWDKLVKSGRISASLAPRMNREVDLFKRGLFYAATGGEVPGIGDGDTVPAMLTPGEFVIRKSAVKALGLDTLKFLNAQKFATGGPVYTPSLHIPQGISSAGSHGIMRGLTDNVPVVNVSLETNIYNPVGENSVLSMNKNLRAQAATGIFGGPVGSANVMER